MLRSVQPMTEQESKEVARVLLHLADVRMRTRQAADALEKAGAAKHVSDALRASEGQLADLHKTLSQST